MEHHREEQDEHEEARECFSTGPPPPRSYDPCDTNYEKATIRRCSWTDYDPHPSSPPSSRVSSSFPRPQPSQIPHTFQPDREERLRLLGVPFLIDGSTLTSALRFSFAGKILGTVSMRPPISKRYHLHVSDRVHKDVHPH